MQIIVNRFNTRYYGFSNWCYIIESLTSSTAVIIDPAWEFHTFHNYLERRNLKVEGVLLTHSHMDHVNLVEKFIHTYNTPVFMSEVEIDYYNYRCKNLRTLQHNQKLLIKEMEFNCYLTPGHTAGSMCYGIDGNLFTGDTVFYEGCGICNTAGGSPGDMFHSIQFIKKYFPDRTRIFPGHVYGVSVGQYLMEVIRDNIYFNIEDIDKFTEFRMRKGQSGWFQFK